MADDQSKKPRVERKTHIVELTGGLQTDQFAESVPVTDCNNVEVLPSGEGMFNRRGHVRWTKYAPKTTPEGRIALVVDSQPPNMSDGTWLISAVDTSVPTNPIVHLQPFKPRTNLSNDTLISQVFFAQSVYYEDYGNEVVLTINRIGALDRTFTVSWATEDGTAEAGTDYTAATGTITFESGDRSKTLTVESLGSPYEGDKDFVVKITDVSVGGVTTSPDKATVVLEGTSSGLFPVAYRSIPAPYLPGRVQKVLGESGAPQVYAESGVWCVDLSATPSIRIAAYVTQFEIKWEDHNPPNDDYAVNPGILGCGSLAPIGVNSYAMSLNTWVSDANRIMKMATFDTAAWRFGKPTYAPPGKTVLRLGGSTIGPDRDNAIYVPTEHFRGGGVFPFTLPSGASGLLGRNAIYLDSAIIPIGKVESMFGDWNDGSGEGEVGNPSANSTEAVVTSDGFAWQVRVGTVGGTGKAYVCKINLSNGALAKAVEAPVGVKLSTFLVLMDDGTPMLFSSASGASGQWILGEGDSWTQLSSSILLRQISHIHNVGDNEVVYIPHGANRIAKGKLHTDAPLEKLFDFDDYAVESALPGPTWLTPTRVFAYNLTANPNTYAIFRVRDGELLETGEFSDAYGGESVDGDANEAMRKSLSGETFNYGSGGSFVAVVAPIPVKKAFY